jgi:hypothetical protein
VSTAIPKLIEEYSKISSFDLSYLAFKIGKSLSALIIAKAIRAVKVILMPVFSNIGLTIFFLLSQIFVILTSLTKLV